MGAFELGDGALVLLHPPAPEVEVDVGNAVLDGRPERPAVLRHEAPQPGARNLVGERPPVVVGDQLVELLEGEVRLAPDVPELEARVVVPGVLVVDEAKAVADVDEVLRQEVVVTGDGALVPNRHGFADSHHLRLIVEIPLRKPEAALLHETQVARLNLEHVEVVAEAARAVELAASGRDPVELVAAPQVLGCLRLPLDELEHEDPVIGEVRDDPSADAGLCGGDAVFILVLSVDGEQARVLRGDAHHVRAALRLDLVVRVREPPGKLGDRGSLAKLGDELEDVVYLRAAAHVA